MTANELTELLKEILVDAYGEDEQQWAFLQSFEDSVDFPVGGIIIGVPVVVLDVEYDGNVRRGLTARCRRDDGSEYAVSLVDLSFPETTSAGRNQAAYRKWLDLEPFPNSKAGGS